MINLKQLHSITGLRVCCVSHGKIVDSYLLTNEEINKINNLGSLINSLPENFVIGIIETNEKERFCIIKAKECFFISPIETENIGEVYKKIANLGGI